MANAYHQYLGDHPEVAAEELYGVFTVYNCDKTEAEILAGFIKETQDYVTANPSDARTKAALAAVQPQAELPLGGNRRN
jgi:hypothetical protein